MDSTRGKPPQRLSTDRIVTLTLDTRFASGQSVPFSRLPRALTKKCSSSSRLLSQRVGIATLKDVAAPGLKVWDPLFEVKSTALPSLVLRLPSAVDPSEVVRQLIVSVSSSSSLLRGNAPLSVRSNLAVSPSRTI